MPTRNELEYRCKLLPMTTTEREVIIQKLRAEYRQIMIDYFVKEKELQTKLEQFTHELFVADIPVPKIIEMHMELIDEFSKQLKLEGRSDETLLDYRLTLIDILAHLCEVYRRAMRK
ncbi:circadian clock protein KaiA [Calothrix sp. NIES-3974]|uniref:circadian clock protein KaiA n=1 Tax=Calothrix sp. NIES-3974 TaxID=2005462 RepID=UPI000B5FBF1A|nr:circadian clock protein KaiA [Calothrix sp. NIES-3974]BAZ07564.1 KaiA family protein [Calothrix sp. NIES-3974]